MEGEIETFIKGDINTISNDYIALKFDDSKNSDLNLIQPNGNEVSYTYNPSTLVVDRDYFVAVIAKDNVGNIG